MMIAATQCQPRNATPPKPLPMTMIQKLEKMIVRMTNVRIPLRWRWALLVGATVALSIGVLTLLVLDVERTSWEQNKNTQAVLLVDRLSDEIKLPMLSGNRVQVQLLLDRFVDQVPDVTTIHLHWLSGKTDHVGTADTPPQLAVLASLGATTSRLALDGLWFGRSISYAKANLGSVAIAFSDITWQQLARKMTMELLLVSFLVLLVAMVAVFWLAGRMSKPMELLAQGSQLVAGGDFTIRLPTDSNDEIGDAMHAFNHMVDELEHKSKMRNDLGRYLHPELLSSVFDDHRHGPTSERMEVTVLFADMVRFTPFSQHADTAEVIETLNSFFGLFNSVITYFGGHVDKFIGDAVMAVFNHPHRDDNHPLQAAMAALAMVECCRRLHLKRPGDGEEVAFRVGINRGEVIVGNIGTGERLEFTVIGDAVNVASRMEGLGSGNQVVASACSFDGYDHRFTLQDLGVKQVKGVAEPMLCVQLSTSDPELLQQIDAAVDGAFSAQFGANHEEILSSG